MRGISTKRLIAWALIASVSAWGGSLFMRLWLDLEMESRSLAVSNALSGTPCVLAGEGQLKPGYKLRGRFERFPPTLVEVWSSAIPKECRDALAANLHRPQDGIVLEWASPETATDARIPASPSPN